MLHPHAYWKDCLVSFGSVIGLGGGSFYTPPQPSKYPEDAIPLQASRSMFMPSIDLKAAVLRQASFLEKVRPYFDSSDQQLRRFKRKYKKFLGLFRKHPGVLLVRFGTSSFSFSDVEHLRRVCRCQPFPLTLCGTRT